MTVDGNTLGIILGLVALATTGATIVGLAIKMRLTGERNAEDIEGNKQALEKAAAELKAGYEKDVFQLRQDHAKEVETLHGRVDRQRDALDNHVAASTEVHTAIAKLTAVTEAILSRLDSIERKIERSTGS